MVESLSYNTTKTTDLCLQEIEHLPIERSLNNTLRVHPLLATPTPCATKFTKQLTVYEKMNDFVSLAKECMSSQEPLIEATPPHPSSMRIVACWYPYVMCGGRVAITEKGHRMENSGRT